jgi:AraC family transcriptional regulator of adaptative response / DNA-3-methyladenine glycosylase II
VGLTVRADVTVSVREPYDWAGVLAFLAARAVPGVERVSGGCYQRTVRFGARTGRVRVSRVRRGLLAVHATGVGPSASPEIVKRVRQLFDTESDPAAVARCFSADPLLAPCLARHRGVRVPGAWDAFELAVRAVLGQQVSVRAATTIAGRLAARFGTSVGEAEPLGCLFPTPGQLADAELERVGVLPSRARTIRLLAARARDGALDLGSPDAAAIAAALGALPGIGPWTTAYIAMRMGDRDSLPSSDLVLRRATGGLSPRALDRRADAWRPWRSYAVMLLWREA